MPPGEPRSRHSGRQPARGCRQVCVDKRLWPPRAPAGAEPLADDGQLWRHRIGPALQPSAVHAGPLLRIRGSSPQAREARSQSSPVRAQRFSSAPGQSPGVRVSPSGCRTSALAVAERWSRPCRGTWPAVRLRLSFSLPCAAGPRRAVAAGLFPRSLANLACSRACRSASRRCAAISRSHCERPPLRAMATAPLSWSLEQLPCLEATCGQRSRKALMCDEGRPNSVPPNRNQSRDRRPSGSVLRLCRLGQTAGEHSVHLCAYVGVTDGR